MAGVRAVGRTKRTKRTKSSRDRAILGRTKETIRTGFFRSRLFCPAWLTSKEEAGRGRKEGRKEAESAYPPLAERDAGGARKH
jgi:hypothetical protein